MLDGQHQRVDIPTHGQNCSQGPCAEKTGSGSLLNRSSSPPDNSFSQGTELKMKSSLKEEGGGGKKKKERKKEEKGTSDDGGQLSMA